jgi:hypothetical protein
LEMICYCTTCFYFPTHLCICVQWGEKLQLQFTIHYYVSKKYFQPFSFISTSTIICCLAYFYYRFRQSKRFCFCAFIPLEHFLTGVFTFRPSEWVSAFSILCLISWREESSASLTATDSSGPHWKKAVGYRRRSSQILSKSLSYHFKSRVWSVHCLNRILTLSQNDPSYYDWLMSCA